MKTLGYSNQLVSLIFGFRAFFSESQDLFFPTERIEFIMNNLARFIRLMIYLCKFNWKEAVSILSGESSQIIEINDNW